MNKLSSQDMEIKIASMALLWSLGYVVRPELLLSEQRTDRIIGDPRRNKYRDLTDVDVLGYVFGPLLHMETIAIDCGSGQKRSPMERVFWANGVMNAIGASQCFCIVGKETEEEHRIAADKMNVTLISASEFTSLSNSISGKAALFDFTKYYDTNFEWLSYLATTNSPLSDYLTHDNWPREWDRVPVALPGQISAWNTRLRLEKPIHQFAFLDMGVLLSIGLVRMACQLALVRPNDLPVAVYNYVLGGGRRAAAIESAIQLLARASGRATGKSQVDLGFEENDVPALVPSFVELLDVTQRLIDRAGAARRIPQYLQAMVLAHLDGDVTTYDRYLLEKPNSYTTKLAIDILNYLRIASNTNSEMMDVVRLI